VGVVSEHDVLRQEINDLKGALEHEQIFRKRKIEYDVVAEKINQLPSRSDLDEYVPVLYPL
jgi:THO complex subunit 7